MLDCKRLVGKLFESVTTRTPTKKNPELQLGVQTFYILFVLRINDNHRTLSLICRADYLRSSSHLQTKCEITFPTTVAPTVSKNSVATVFTSFQKNERINHSEIILAKNFL